MATGWRPLQEPEHRRGANAFVVSPFTRLARAHAVSAAGDSLVAIALAGSLFFSIDPSAARTRVLLYLVLTLAPFAVVAPLIGPFLDRMAGGRRWMVAAAAGGRAVLCFLLIRHIDTLFLFPEAFGLLVCSKAYAVAKSALVPTVVHSDAELVAANSKLSLLSGIMGFLAAIPGGILLQLGGSGWVVGLGVGVFFVAAVLGVGIPATTVATTEVTAEERAELRGAGVLLAVSAMGLLRGIVGYLTFLLAFALRNADAPSWHFAVIVGASVAGSLAGAALAPSLRRVTGEETMITGVLAGVAAIAVLAAATGGLGGAMVLALSVGAAGSTAKLAFDAIVQRDAPDANRGRSFARFETRFQLIWVIGALAAVVPLPIPARAGYVIIASVAAFAAISYYGGRRVTGTHQQRVRSREQRAARGNGNGDETRVEDAAPARAATTDVVEPVPEIDPEGLPPSIVTPDPTRPYGTDPTGELPTRS